MRLFVAIEFPREVAAEVRKRIQTLARTIQDPKSTLRWVNQDQLHVTLKFLGEVRETSVGSLIAGLRGAALGHSAFDLRLGGMGGFGGQDGYRVIWLGMGEGAKNASLLAEAIEDACEPLGFPRENRRFHPHVTLARCKTGSCRVQMESLKPELLDQDVAHFTVDHIALIQSTLTPRGPLYKTLEKISLLAH